MEREKKWTRRRDNLLVLKSRLVTLDTVAQ